MQTIEDSKSGATLTDITDAPKTVEVCHTRSQRRAVIVGGFVSVSVTVCFLLLFWNRFAGFRSGDGGFFAARMFFAGFLPYRDYFCPNPPLSIITFATVLKLFGNYIIVLRAFGIVERAALSLVLYAWLVRFFRARDAALAVAITMVVSACDVAEPISSYNHQTILLATLAGFAASFALDRSRSERALALTGLLSGISGSLCLASKHTIGIAIMCAVPVVIGACLLRSGEKRKAAIFSASFAIGSAIPLGAIVLWLHHTGLLQAFMQQAFVRGPAAKASHPADFLVRSIDIAKDYSAAALAACIALLFSFAAMRRSGLDNGARSSGTPISPGLLLISASIAFGVVVAFVPTRAENVLRLIPIVVLSGAALLLVKWGILRLRRPLSDREWKNCLAASLCSLPALLLILGWPMLAKYTFMAVGELLVAGFTLSKASIYFTLISTLVLGVYYFVSWVRGELTWRQAQYLLLAAVSFSVAFMLALSWPAFEAMVVPGLAFLLAAMLDGWNGWRRAVLVSICASILFAITCIKLQEPFGFGHLHEGPVRTANSRSQVAELKGLLLPEEDVRFIDTTADIIRANSSPEDTIFTYPEMALFYGISGRKFPTFSGSHNYDLVSDTFAKREAERLLSSRPAVLIYAPEPEAFVRGSEAVWRGGKPSGQRDMAAAVEALANQYRLAARFKVGNQSSPVFVFVRPDGSASSSR